MPVNPYFQSGLGPGISSEQHLVEDLVIESLKIHGQEVYYLPRTQTNVDKVFVEDAMAKFTSVLPIEMYMANVSGFEGSGELFTKFGIQVTDQATFIVAKRRWEESVLRTGAFTLPPRPNEGDLIYFPLTKSFFEVKYVQHLNPFFQLGKFYVYSLQCELFQYSSERIETGDPEIDTPLSIRSRNLLDNTMLDEEGEALLDEQGNQLIRNDAPSKLDSIFDQDDEFEVEGENILDFSITNPFGEIG